MLPRPPRPVRRRLPGELTASAFMRGLLDAVRERLPHELRALESRQQGSLVKFYADDPAIHFELNLHYGRARMELGLHFETRDAARNARLLDYVASELPFLKEALGASLEAEPWDKGWTRLYLTRHVERLDQEHLASLAETFTTFIAVVDPICQEAIEDA